MGQPFENRKRWIFMYDNMSNLHLTEDHILSGNIKNRVWIFLKGYTNKVWWTFCVTKLNNKTGDKFLFIVALPILLESYYLGISPPLLK
jgi:hypothetical protein